MSFHATNRAGFPHLYRCPVEQVNERLQRGNADDELRPSYRGHASRVELRLRQTSAANLQVKTLLGCASAVIYAVICSVTASRPLRRTALLGLLLRVLRPFGLASSRDRFENQGKQRRRILLSGPPRRQTFGTREWCSLAKLRPL